MKFSNKVIATYYSTTQNHHENWSKLKEMHPLHNGIWNKTTKNFIESLLNTSKKLMNITQASSTGRVLNARYVVEGTSFFSNIAKGG